MKTIKLKGFIHMYPSRHGDHFTFFSSDMTQAGYLIVGPHEIEYEMPANFNQVAVEVACLEKKLESINKEHTDQVIKIKERIASLLCIENRPNQTAEF